jgi:hypothetical protein
MASLSVQIVEFLEASSYPAIVACEFTDAGGRRHRVIDKLPIFTAQDLRKDSMYPQPGEAECLVLGTVEDGERRKLICIRTLETTRGETEFVVEESQVSFGPDSSQ